MLKCIIHLPITEMKLYTELGTWWPPMLAPEGGVEGPAFYTDRLKDTCGVPPGLLLVPFDHSELEPGTYQAFVGRKR